MTLAQFTEIFVLLAMQLRFSDADEATVRAYFKALSDLEPELVAMAAQRFAQGAALNSQGEAWFPKAPEWRVMAARVERDRWMELDRIIRRHQLAGDVLCRECEDTGWAKLGTRYLRCACRDLRKLEVLGRRPMPALPAGEPEADATQLAQVEHLAVQHVKAM